MCWLLETSTGRLKNRAVASCWRHDLVLGEAVVTRSSLRCSVGVAYPRSRQLFPLGITRRGCTEGGIVTDVEDAAWAKLLEWWIEVVLLLEILV
ncbi:hypothetical protein BHE74_00058057 [Ensete ventricosum]|nr:hypothetical protein BHE74_00058057 [Ensete ventricosum]